jgi:hypothetical protein
VPLINAQLDSVYSPDLRYRCTGIVLAGLRGEGGTQLDLFGEVLRAERARRLFDAIDGLDAKYGKHTVFLGSSFAAMPGPSAHRRAGGTPAPPFYAASRRE